MEDGSYNDEFHTLANAAKKFLPRPNGRPVAPSTIWRWANKGVSMPDGGRIKLQVWHCGGSTYTTPNACREFIDRQTNARQAPSQLDWPRRSDETSRKLSDAGLL